MSLRIADQMTAGHDRTGPITADLDSKKLRVSVVSQFN
jgi:hypothetical protein